MHFIEPAYPALLGGLRAVGGDSLTVVLLAQIGIAAAAGVLLHRLTADLAGPRAAIAAAVLYAIDPYLVRQSVSLVEVTLCTALLIAAARFHARSDGARDAALTGIALALAALTRISLLPIAFGAVGLYLWRRRPRLAAAAAAAAGVPVAAWMIVSSAATGGALPARAGINLFVSTSQDAGQVAPLHNVDYLVPYAYESIASEVPAGGGTDVELERLRDRALLRRSLDFARRQPLQTLGLKLRNLLFTVVPVLLPLDPKPRGATATIENGVVRFHDAGKRPLRDHVIYSGFRAMLLIAAVAGFLRRRPRHHAEALLFVMAGCVIAVCAIFFPTSRLLAPASFVMMVYAGIGLWPLALDSWPLTLDP
jgi:hypothetical protein